MICDRDDVWWFMHWTEAGPYWRDTIVVAWRPSHLHSVDGDASVFSTPTALTICSLTTLGGRLILPTHRGPNLPRALAAEILSDIADRTNNRTRAMHYLDFDLWERTYTAEWAEPSEYHAAP